MRAIARVSEQFTADYLQKLSASYDPVNKPIVVTMNKVSIGKITRLTFDGKQLLAVFSFNDKNTHILTTKDDLEDGIRVASIADSK